MDLRAWNRRKPSGISYTLYVHVREGQINPLQSDPIECHYRMKLRNLLVHFAQGSTLKSILEALGETSKRRRRQQEVFAIAYFMRVAFVRTWLSIGVYAIPQREISDVLLPLIDSNQMFSFKVEVVPGWNFFLVVWLKSIGLKSFPFSLYRDQRSLGRVTYTVVNPPIRIKLLRDPMKPILGYRVIFARVRMHHVCNT